VNRVTLIRIRRIRDNARWILYVGFLLYVLGFFLDWPLGIEWSWIPRYLGIVIAAAGGAASFLWLVDRDPRQESE
jgi:hypothetical protein